MRRSLILVATLASGATDSARAQSDEAAQRIARTMIPQVERAVGLTFRRPPVIATRSREQVRAFINAKMAKAYPPAETKAIQRAYRAFGVIPETLDIRRLQLDLLAEQVAGFYEPDSGALFVVRGADPAMLRLVLAHELVHALQDQYMRLSAILDLRRQNDRQMAGQAVAEGQAVVASLQAINPGAQLPESGRAWEAVREAIRAEQSGMPVFAAAPRIMQEGLMFPYLAGADFWRSYQALRSRPDEMPYGERLPISTEQLLHPAKYSSSERPVRLAFGRTSGDTLIYDDDFGEFETGIVLEVWGARNAEATAAAAGWHGDRFEVRGVRGGTALLWAMAFDTEDDAGQFERLVRRVWESRGAGSPGGRVRRRVDRVQVRGVPIVRLTEAPVAWTGWQRVPPIIVSGDTPPLR